MTTTLQASSGNTGAGLLLGAVFIAAFVLYWVPSAIAVLRQHHQLWAIIAINLFLGWSLIGWVVALAIALSSKPQPAVQQVLYQSGAYVERRPPAPQLPEDIEE